MREAANAIGMTSSVVNLRNTLDTTRAKWARQLFTATERIDYADALRGADEQARALLEVGPDEALPTESALTERIERSI